MTNQQATRFEAIAIMNRSIKKTTPNSWVLECDGVIVGTIEKTSAGYLVKSSDVTPEPFSHFSRALASMIDNFARCAQYLKTRQIYLDAIMNMQPRVKYFAANPQNDPFVIALRRDESSAISVLTNEGISDFTWCEIHTEKLPKTIVMVNDFITAKQMADKVIQNVNKNMGDAAAAHPFFKREISVMRFSEATAANVAYYLRKVDEMTIHAHNLGYKK